VRAENQLGVAAESFPGRPFRLDVIDDSDARISYSTGWALTSDSAAYGGGLHTISTADSTATMTFSGQSLAVVVPLGQTNGSIRICIDPGVSVAGCTTATLHSTTAVERDIVYVSGALTAGSHTVQVTNASGSPIALDGFVVLG
jgi:hypothetical protein